MSDTQEFTANPFESLQAGIQTRKLELDFLLEHFAPALELIADHDRLNEIIEASPRPDLVFVDPAQQMQIGYPYKPGDINNFNPGMRSFGPRVFEEIKDTITGKIEIESLGRRPPTRQELDTYFILGARGDYAQHMAFCDKNNIDDETAYDTILLNHANKGAFMRMWIGVPVLTEQLMAVCLDDRSKPQRSTYEEIFVAYTIMSQLVDKRDKYVDRDNGKLDDWLLCR